MRTGSNKKEVELRNRIEELALQNADKLYAKYASLIISFQKAHITPDAITLHLATILYMDEFLADMSEKTPRTYTKATVRRYKRSIADIVKRLPEKPMHTLKEYLIKKELSATKNPSVSQKCLYVFWAFCKDSGYCIGNNPVPPPPPREARGSNLNIKNLSDEDLDKLHDYCLTLSDPKCKDSDPAIASIALFIWGGHSVESIAKFTWKDILFEKSNPDYVRVKLISPQKAGPLNDYTCPVMPQCAQLLHRAQMVQHASGPDAHVVQNRDGKAMTSTEVSQHITAILTLSKIAENLRITCPSLSDSALNKIARDTYAHLLLTKCGLGNSPETTRFLLHRLPDYTTCRRYASFTDNYGQQRLFSYLRRAIPNRGKRAFFTPDEHDGQYELSYRPAQTQQRARFSDKIILQPGEAIRIESQFGCTVDAKVIEENADT